MSKAGNFAAFQSARPTTEDFGDNMLQAENQQFRYREEKRVEDQIKYRRQRDREDRMAADFEKMKPVITGVSTLDEINTRMLNQGMRNLGDIHRELSSNNLPPEKRQELLYKKNMITKLPEFMSAATKNITDWTATTSKLIEEGKASDWDLLEMERAEAHFGVRGEDGRMTPNFVVDIDEKGHPVGKFITANGEYGELSYIDVINGVRFNGNTTRYDAGEFTSDLAGTLGERQQTRIKSGRFETYQTFDQIEKEVSEMLDARLGTAEDPSDLAKSMWADSENMGKDPRDFNQDSIKQIKQNLMTNIRAQYDETIRSMALPRNNSNDLSVSEREKREKATSLHRLATTGAMGAMDALASIKGQQSYTMIDGKSTRVVAGMPYQSGGNIIIPDSEGEHILAEIPIATSPDQVQASANQLLPWLYSKSPTEAVDLFDLGAKLNNGAAYPVGSTVQEMEIKEVGELEGLETLSKIGNSGSSEKFRRAIPTDLKTKLKDAGFTLRSGDDMVGNNELIIDTPTGQTFEVKMQIGNAPWNRKPNPDAPKEIEEIIRNHQINKKKKPVPVGGATQTVAPTEGDRLGLGL